VGKRGFGHDNTSHSYDQRWPDMDNKKKDNNNGREENREGGVESCHIKTRTELMERLTEKNTKHKILHKGESGG